MLMDITVIVRPEEDASFRRQLVETIVVWVSRCRCSRYSVDDGGVRISSERSPGRCPVSTPRRGRFYHGVVIFSHRFFDSDFINFKTFVFLAVY